MGDTTHLMPRKRPNQRTHAQTYGAERGLNRFEGFTDAVFAIILTLLIVEIKVPGAVTLAAGLAFAACTWMAKWFYGIPGRRLVDERLAPDFLQQMTRRYGIATLIQIAAIPVAIAAPRIGVTIALLCITFFLLPQPKLRYRPGEEPIDAENSND